MKHVFVIGDSLSTDFYVGGFFQTLQELFVTTRPVLFKEALKNQEGVQLHDYSNPGASVMKENISFISRVEHHAHLEDQVKKVCSQPVPVDLLCLWIGHNDLDISLMREEETIDVYTKRFISTYKSQLEKVVHTKQPKHIIIFGLINMEYFFKARNEVADYRHKNPGSYRYFQKCFTFFPALTKQHQAQVIAMQQHVNRKLADIAEDLNQQYKTCVSFTDCLSRVDISERINLNKNDGWHPSDSGRRKLATTIKGHLKEEFDWIK